MVSTSWRNTYITLLYMLMIATSFMHTPAKVHNRGAALYLVQSVFLLLKPPQARITEGS